jgi:hypothetical protein
MAKTGKKLVTKREETRTLKVELTQDELLSAGQKAADAQQTIVELDLEEKQVKDGIKGRRAVAEADLGRNSTLVRQKYDFRPIICEVTLDHTDKTVCIKRTDTGVVVESRKMNDQEAEELPLE